MVNCGALAWGTTGGEVGTVAEPEFGFWPSTSVSAPIAIKPTIKIRIRHKYIKWA